MTSKFKFVTTHFRMYSTTLTLFTATACSFTELVACIRTSTKYLHVNLHLNTCVTYLNLISHYCRCTRLDYFIKSTWVWYSKPLGFWAQVNYPPNSLNETQMPAVFTLVLWLDRLFCFVRPLALINEFEGKATVSLSICLIELLALPLQCRNVIRWRDQRNNIL